MPTVFSILFLLCGLIVAPPLWAKDFFLSWAPDPQATSYVVYISQDTGVAWKKLREVTVPNITISTPTDAPDNMMIHVRISAKNAQNETMRNDSGIWLNTAWSPMQVSQLEVK